MKAFLTAITLALVLLAAAVYAQNNPRQLLLALSKHDHTLALVDPGSLKILARVPIGNDPHEVIASADGSTAYVSNYGFGAFNTITPVDLATQRALPAIDLGPLRGPHGLAYAGGKLWFTAEAAKVIARYDPQSQKVDWVLGTGQNRTHMIYIAQDLKRIVTTNVSSGTVSIIEKTAGGPGGPPPGAPNGPPPAANMPGGPPPGPPGGDWDEAVVEVGRSSEGFDISPDGKEIWAANAQQGTIAIIDVAGKKLAQTLAANVRGANRLKFTPDGKLVLVSSLSGPEVAVFDASSRTSIKRIKIGGGAAGIVMQPDGLRAFVACTPDGYLAIIDLSKLEVVGHIDVGPQPDGLAWAIVEK